MSPWPEGIKRFQGKTAAGCPAFHFRKGFCKMVHYTCDLCGRTIGEQRFITKVEVAPAFDPDELSEEDLDVDHLEQIAEFISENEAADHFDLPETETKKFQFDLCSACARHYLKAPLGPVRPAARLNYSQN